MKQKWVKLAFFGLFSMTLLFGADKIIALGKPPVDEGGKKDPKEDKVKGATTVTNVFKSETLSLSKESGGVYHIAIHKVSQAPLTCKVIRGGIELESLSKKQRKNLVFDINTSLLKIDDNITLINRNGRSIVEVLVKE